MKLEELNVYQCRKVMNDESFNLFAEDIDSSGVKLNNYNKSIGKKIPLHKNIKNAPTMIIKATNDSEANANLMTTK